MRSVLLWFPYAELSTIKTSWKTKFMSLSSSNEPTPANRLSLYDRDFYAWTQQQAKLLRDRHFHHLDLPNLIEEVESLGKQQRQELRNRLSVLIGHLLKWEFQPQCRSRSWLATIRIQRIEIQQLLEDNPSLKPYLEDMMAFAFQQGRNLAMGETDLPSATFPTTCEYGLDEVLSDRFFPGEPCGWIDE